MPLMKRVKENCKWMCVIKRDYTLCVISQSSPYSARQTAGTMKPENGYDADFVVTDDIRVCHNKLRCCHWREYWFDVNFDVNFVAGSTRGCHNDNLQCGQCCHHDNSQLCKSYNQRRKSTNHCRLLWWQCYHRKICNAIKKSFITFKRGTNIFSTHSFLNDTKKSQYNKNAIISFLTTS